MIRYSLSDLCHIKNMHFVEEQKVWVLSEKVWVMSDKVWVNSDKCTLCRYLKPRFLNNEMNEQLHFTRLLS